MNSRIEIFDYINKSDFDYFLTIKLPDIYYKSPDKKIEKFIKFLNNKINKRHKNKSKLLQFVLIKETGNRTFNTINPHYHFLIQCNRDYTYLTESLLREKIYTSAEKIFIPNNKKSITKLKFLSGKSTHFIDLKKIENQENLIRYILKETKPDLQTIYFTPTTPENYYPFFI